MATERRFRGFMLAHVELVEARDDGSVAVIGLSGSGDAVAMVVQPETIDDLLLRLRIVRPDPPPPADAPFTPVAIPACSLADTVFVLDRSRE